jgi:hypothetical protein
MIHEKYEKVKRRSGSSARGIPWWRWGVRNPYFLGEKQA